MAVCATAKRMRTLKLSTMTVVLLCLAGCAGHSGWASQDQKMFVESKNWTIGEFKNCITQNVDLEEPTLHCDDDVVGKVFEVRFYGRTFEPNKPDLVMSRWTCQKNERIDPSITCRDKK
jgi:hypothetical protein